MSVKGRGKQEEGGEAAGEGKVSKRRYVKGDRRAEGGKRKERRDEED